jgi:hypothetical protein
VRLISPPSSSNLVATAFVLPTCHHAFFALTLLFASSFSFSDLKISSDKPSNKALVRETNEKLFVNGKETSGLYDYVYTVTATVENTGSVAGAEVAQVRPLSCSPLPPFSY